jgi:hypothetical protein
MKGLTYGHPVLFGIFAGLTVGLAIAGLVVNLAERQPTTLGLILSGGAWVPAVMWIAIRASFPQTDSVATDQQDVDRRDEGGSGPEQGGCRPGARQTSRVGRAPRSHRRSWASPTPAPDGRRGGGGRRSGA